MRITEAGVEGRTSTGTLWKETHRTWHAHLRLVGSSSPLIPTLLRNVARDKCPPPHLVGVMRADGKNSNSPGYMGGLDSFSPLASHRAE